ncbi:MAG: hypothetical protein CMF74_13310 [Maricaulis sp.]|jgi:septal ring factor EnvC (AmiA/AmiB activator)|nr:hypothetical protein [Maricaulis sp.]
MPLLPILFLMFQPVPEETPPPDPAEIERLESEQRAAEAAAEAARTEAEALAREIADLQHRLVEAGRRADASERAALAAESRIGELSGEEAEILARLSANRETLALILAALQRIERGTPPALAAAPEDALQAARAAGLFAEITPALRDRAEELSLQLDRLRGVRRDTATEQDRLGQAESALAAQRSEIEALIAERRALEAGLRAEAETQSAAAAAAGREAQSVRELLARLEAMREVLPRLAPRRTIDTDDGAPLPALRPDERLTAALAPDQPLDTLRFADARGRLRPPAAGAVTRRFGTPNENGQRSEGLVIQTRARAQVVAPFDAVVEYAGPFGSYHGLLILNVGDDYYIVLAGMTALYTEAGQSVLAGEPVGTMPDQEEPAPDLYVEIRRNGDAIDPQPWLRPVAGTG